LNLSAENPFGYSKFLGMHSFHGIFRKTKKKTYRYVARDLLSIGQFEILLLLA